MVVFFRMDGYKKYYYFIFSDDLGKYDQEDVLIAPHFRPVKLDEVDTDTEACTSKSGSTLAEELYLLKREQSNSQKSKSTGPPKSPMDSEGNRSSNTEKLLSKPMSTYGRKADRDKNRPPGQQVCKKEDDKSQSKSTSDKSTSSKAALAEAKKKEVHMSFESKAHDETLSLTERICRKQINYGQL